MGGNGSSVEAMETMIKMLTKFQEVQQDMETQLKRQYDAVGDEWKDVQYKNLGNVLNDIYTTFNTGYVQVSECITKVQLLKGKLKDYLDANI